MVVLVSDPFDEKVSEHVVEVSSVTRAKENDSSLNSSNLNVSVEFAKKDLDRPTSNVDLFQTRKEKEAVITAHDEGTYMSDAVSLPYEPQSKMLSTCKAPEIRWSNAFCEINPQDISYLSQVPKDYNIIFFNGKVKYKKTKDSRDTTAFHACKYRIQTICCW